MDLEEATMKHSNHPIWATIDTLVIGCLVLGGLWITATNFDASELKAIGIIIGPYIAWKFGEHRMRREKVQKVEVE